MVLVLGRYCRPSYLRRFVGFITLNQNRHSRLEYTASIEMFSYNNKPVTFRE